MDFDMEAPGLPELKHELNGAGAPVPTFKIVVCVPRNAQGVSHALLCGVSVAQQYHGLVWHPEQRDGRIPFDPVVEVRRGDYPEHVVVEISGKVPQVFSDGSAAWKHYGLAILDSIIKVGVFHCRRAFTDLSGAIAAQVALPPRFTPLDETRLRTGQIREKLTERICRHVPAAS